MKKTIAIDIDDVLADQAEAFINYSNRTWGTQLTTADYTEHWIELWNVSGEELNNRAETYHTSGVMGVFNHKSEALPVLKKLKQTYRLVIVTSRRMQVKDETLMWIEKYFENVFDEIHFAGFFDNLDKNRWNMTKADIVEQLGASYLIDDQLKHCLATANCGIETILFGNYKWNQIDTLPERITRCKSWKDVEAYFESRR